MQSPAASLSFILQRERFVSAYSLLSAIYAGRNIAKLLRQSRFPAYRLRVAHLFSLGWESEVPIFFFSNIDFAAVVSLSRAGFSQHQAKRLAHATGSVGNVWRTKQKIMKTRRADCGIYFPVECFVAQNLRGNYQASQLSWKKRAWRNIAQLTFAQMVSSSISLEKLQSVNTLNVKKQTIFRYK